MNYGTLNWGLLYRQPVLSITMDYLYLVLQWTTLVPHELRNFKLGIVVPAACT